MRQPGNGAATAAGGQGRRLWHLSSASHRSFTPIVRLTFVVGTALEFSINDGRRIRKSDLPRLVNWIVCQQDSE